MEIIEIMVWPDIPFDLKVGIILRMLSALNLANNGIFQSVWLYFARLYQISSVKIEKHKLRWSETNNLKISNPDNIFFLYLIMIKLCTLKQLENIHQKLKFS